MMFVPEFQARNSDNVEWLRLHGIDLVDVTLASGEMTPMGRIPQRCSKLTDDGRCGIWEDRPAVCRKFPEEPLHLVGLTKCTYEFEGVSG